MSEILLQIKNPLSLLGLALLLMFSIHKAMIRSGIIPQLDRRSGSMLALAMLRYGFQICVLLIVAGFILTALNILPNPLAKSFEKSLHESGDVVALRDFFLRIPGRPSI